ncbi:hypothetical protein OVY48_15660 [Sphingobium sp. SA2]|uniref:hypothetical protein n=1 Tax=Sphingobium sp. SA2 TaxID=1524832 RepID=UPI0028C2AABC|nr:hypothetical protein [Sphingobium sp. SA2]MDT7534849.1 hypothetical protein [Sphingobium sp. SA2]
MATAAITGSVCLYAGFWPGWISADWTSTEAVPFPVRAKLEIASRWYPLKRSAVSLLCGPDGTYLMLRTRLPMPNFIRENMRPSTAFTSHTEIILDWQRVPGGISVHSFKTKSAIVALVSIDTIVSQPLTKIDQTTLLDWLHRGAPQGLTYAVFESSVGKHKTVTDAGTVSTFFQKCGSRS